jgi:hypothetical protein
MADSWDVRRVVKGVEALVRTGPADVSERYIRTYCGARRPARSGAFAVYARPMWSQRSYVDYGLQRRAALRELFSGGALRSDLCDADPYLLRAAQHHGEPTDRPCPVCRREKLTHLTYVFGDELGQYSGRIRATRELEPMAREHGEFTVYVVEVCRGCEWNHLAWSFVLGDGVPRAAPRRRRADA